MRLITDAPTFVVRELATFARGVRFESIGWDGDDTPAWAATEVTGSHDSDLFPLSRAIAAGGYRIEGWNPRPAIANPTYAMAAARIDRERGGNAAPAAQAWR